MLEELTSEELSRWQALFALEPWGGAREDLRVGLLASLLHNAWFSGGTRRPHDWFPNLEQDRPQQTPHEAAAAARRWVQQTGGVVR